MGVDAWKEVTGQYVLRVHKLILFQHLDVVMLCIKVSGFAISVIFEIMLIILLF